MKIMENKIKKTMENEKLKYRLPWFTSPPLWKNSSSYLKNEERVLSKQNEEVNKMYENPKWKKLKKTEITKKSEKK